MPIFATISYWNFFFLNFPYAVSDSDNVPLNLREKARTTLLKINADPERARRAADDPRIVHQFYILEQEILARVTGKK